jgi:thiol:disulfide interchange protein DsbC
MDMGKKAVKGFWGALLIVLLAAMTAWAEAPHGSPKGSPPQESQQKSPFWTIKAVKALPTNGLVVMETNQGVFFASAEGRFVLKGPLFDMWSHREIKSVADVDSIASRVDLKKVGVDFSQLAVFTFGEGNQEEVFFISPTCPHCQTVMNQAAKLAKEYRFKLVLLPQSRKDMDIARRMICTKDQDQAVKALLSRNYEALPPGNCPLTPLQKNLVTARMLGITKVPYLVRHDHMINAGAVKDLAAWLKGSAHLKAGGQ